MKRVVALLLPAMFAMALGFPGAVAADFPAKLARIRERPLPSTSVAAAGYNRAARVLQLRFSDGATYQYAGVPEPVYRQLLAAESKGQFFVAAIRGKFAYRKVIRR